MKREFAILYDSYTGRYRIIFRDNPFEHWSVWLNVDLPQAECEQMVEALNG